MEKASSAAFQVASEMAWQVAGEGVKRQVMGYDGQLMVVKVDFETGAIGTPHTHPHSQATYVASGKFKVKIGEEETILQQGDGYYVAPDVLHGCVCLEAGRLVDTFSPMRRDFLP